MRATEAVRVGNLDPPDLPVDSQDEIGILARSFRAMLEELREKAALEQYVASLNLTPGMGGEFAETVVAGRFTARPPARAWSPRSGASSPRATRSRACSGKGGMGVVYRAHDRELDDAVAIKMLRGEALTADPTLLDRFKQEIRLARRITHPNVLRTHDFGETGGLRYISMEFVKGLTLKQLVEAGALPTPVGLRIAKQICAGLEAAHEVGVIHRDIKPQNILIDATGDLKIMDFGIARLEGGARHDGATGTVIGTPDYMSPEQARGKPARLPLRHLLAGRRPLRGLHRHAALRRRHAAGGRAQAHPGEPAVAAGAQPQDRSEDLADRPEVHAEGPEGPLSDVNELYEALTRVTAA